MRTAKSLISLRILTVWSGSFLRPTIYSAAASKYNNELDQIVRMCMLFWTFIARKGRKGHFIVLFHPS